jgi:hypothetical protein
VSDTPIEDRTFTDDEVREILKKAVERAPSRAVTKREGLSLSDLKAIGQEVGIDPARVEDAARAVTRSDRRRVSGLLGAPIVMDFERTVAGTIAPRETPEVLAIIRRTMGQQGDVTEVHGSVEWSVKGDSGDTYVTVHPKEGATTIRGSANLSTLAAITYLPAGMIGLMASIGMIGAGASSGSPLGVVAGLSVLPVLYATLRAVMGRFANRRAARLQEVVDELARLPKVESEADPAQGPVDPPSEGSGSAKE